MPYIKIGSLVQLVGLVEFVERELVKRETDEEPKLGKAEEPILRIGESPKL